MRAGSVLCIPLGHRWREAADVHEPYPVLRCRRCGRVRELALGAVHGVPMSARTNHCAGTWTGEPSRRD